MKEKIEQLKQKLSLLPRNYLFLFLGVYLLASGFSFIFFSSVLAESEIVSPIQTEEDLQAGKLVFTGPKDQECPINGAYFTAGEKKLWEQKKPLLVMIENHEESRPHSGLTRADVVYETVAEGGITRFMGVYYCQAAAPVEKKYDLGPVRSARTYFLDWASEYDNYPLYVHVGGAGQCHDQTVDPRAKALCQIEQYGWKDKDHWSDLDQFALSYQVCRREPERTGQKKATEHTMYCDTQALWQEAEKRGFSGWERNEFTSWKFKDDLSPEEREAIGVVDLYFWKGYQAYDVSWQYDQESNEYLRVNGGEEQKDFISNELVKSKVVVIQFTQELGPLGIHKHLLYKTIREGKALVFQDGQVIKGSWEKPERTARTLFYNQKGEEIKFNRGLIWIEILPQNNKVEYGSG